MTNSLQRPLFFFFWHWLPTFARSELEHYVSHLEILPHFDKNRLDQSTLYESRKLTDKSKQLSKWSLHREEVLWALTSHLSKKKEEKKKSYDMFAHFASILS